MSQGKESSKKIYRVYEWEKNKLMFDMNYLIFLDAFCLIIIKFFDIFRYFN